MGPQRASGGLTVLAQTPATAQTTAPVEGDIIFTARAFNDLTGKVVCFHPQTYTYTTLANQVGSRSFIYQIAMAEDNANLVVSQTDANCTTSNLVWFTPQGIATTMVGGISGEVTALELDGDNTWVVSSDSGGVLGVNRNANPTVTTFMVPRSTNDDYQGVTIVRDGGITYAVANSLENNPLGPKIFTADRNGLVTTLIQGNPVLDELFELKYIPTTGMIMATSGGGKWDVARITLSGTVSSFTRFNDAEGIHPMLDNTAYVIGQHPEHVTNTITKYDLTTRAALVSYPLPSNLGPQLWECYGITTYGSRILCCNGQGGPGQRIAVNIQSHRPGTAGKYYQLACALSRQPGLKMTNDEWLMLNPSDPLFVVTATNQAGPITQDFAGTLDATGHASAAIQLPAAFPKNLNLTVFCAGIIYDTTHGVIQVTNAHWFEL